MKNLFLFFVLLIAFSSIYADDDKTITLINVQDTTHAQTNIQREKLDECMSMIAHVDDLEATTTMKTYYLKGINGDNSKNDWVKDYTASIEVPYMITQRKIIIITTQAVNPKDPTFKEVNKNFQKSKRFRSDSSNGDLFGGRSKRKYLFSSKEAAIEDVKQRAKAWISMQRAVMCEG